MGGLENPLEIMPSYNRRTHNPMAEKPVAQNVTKRVKTKASNVKLVITKNKNKNKNRKNTKKTKRLTEIQVLTKRLTKRVFKKKMKVKQLFKPINY